jgi:fructose-bisphosphate aldolase class II
MVEHNSTLEGLSNAGEKAAIAGGIAGALHSYGGSLQTTVILHTDHCAKKIPWLMDY